MPNIQWGSAPSQCEWFSLLWATNVIGRSLAAATQYFLQITPEFFSTDAVKEEIHPTL